MPRAGVGFAPLSVIQGKCGRAEKRTCRIAAARKCILLALACWSAPYSLLVLGATAVIQFAKPGRPGVSAWLLKLLERKPRKLAAEALANKMARIVWAMLTSGEAYRRPDRHALQLHGGSLIVARRVGRPRPGRSKKCAECQHC